MTCAACGEPLRSGGGVCPSCGAARRPSAADLEAAFSEPAPPLGGPRVGHDFGPRYHIVKTVGAGGMGIVYQALDRELNVSVALKMLRGAPGGVRMAAELQRRFITELLLARQITHKNVIRIHDIGEVNGIRFISMPYINGDDLGTSLAEGPLPIARTLRYARHLASGLMAVHGAGVVHRDIKPANVMIDEGDQAVLMDFGIARSSAPNATQFTAPGASPGTMAYMAPEQARGEQADQRTDIYAFGLLLQEMITGTRELSALEILGRMKAAPTSLRRIDPEVPEALDEIVTRCLQPNPSKRFQTAVELAQAIAKLPRGGRGHDRDRAPIGALLSRWLPRVAAVAGIALLVALGYWSLTSGVASKLAHSLMPGTVAAAPEDNEGRIARSGPAVVDASVPQPVGAIGTAFEAPPATPGFLPPADAGGSGEKETSVDAVRRDDFWAAAREAANAIREEATPASAREAYERLAATGAEGASRAATGLADLAIYRGDAAEAAELLESAIARELRTTYRLGLAMKYIALAEARAAQGRRPDAVTAVRNALATDRDESVLLPAARLYIALDRNDDARALARELESANDSSSRAYGQVVDAELALDRGDTTGAIETLLRALKTADLWIARYVLGNAYLQSKQYPEAVAQLNMCEVRRGEATALFHDDQPSVRYLGMLEYLRARALDGAGMTREAAEAFRQFLQLRAGSPNGGEERDARQRLERLASDQSVPVKAGLRRITTARPQALK